MRTLAFLACLNFFGSCVFAADAQVLESGKQEEQRSCIQCHSLRLVDSQRLSRAAWEKEINKMIGWGAPVRDKQALLEYLAEECSDSKPMPQDELTGNGAQGQNHSQKSK